MKPDNLNIHGLWIGKELSPMEILTIESFLQNGHKFNLWTYEEVINVPDGAEVRNAVEIVPEKMVFSYKHRNKFGHGKGSYAGFSDIFRYKLLYEHGGIWVDMDITCLKPFDFADEYLFRYHHKYERVGNIMKCPQGAEVMEWCYKRAVVEVDSENVQWELPIRILNDGINQYDLTGHTKMISNDDSWPLVAKHVGGKPPIPNNWYAIHWMNEEWRRLGLNKERVYPDSNLQAQFAKYRVRIDTLSGMKKMYSIFKLNRFYYGLKNFPGMLRRTFESN